MREIAWLLGGIWAILFPVILLLGLRFGIFTPSEIGAFAVVYAVVVGMIAYRALTRASIKEALEGSLVDIGAVMFLLALSAIFGYGIVFENIPEVISNWMLGLTDNPSLVMILIVLFILLAGTFMEGSVLIIMLTPIFLPLVAKYGIDPVHFGLVFIIAATIGNFTPPVGAAMFVVCQILKCRIGDYTRESMPFLIAVSAVTLLLIFLPEIVLLVPDLIFGKDSLDFTPALLVDVGEASMNRPRNLTFGLAARLACLAALCGVLVSCAKLEPDRLATYPALPGRHSILILGHGYHTGLVVRAREVPETAWPARRDFPDAEYLELGWGERSTTSTTIRDRGWRFVPCSLRRRAPSKWWRSPDG